MGNETNSVFPARPYYTLRQAADELNIAFKRSDIDEDYLLQLAANGSIGIVTKSNHYGLKFDDTGDIFEIIDSGIVNDQYRCKDEIVDSIKFAGVRDGYFLELNIECVRFFAFSTEHTELLQHQFTDFFPYVTYSNTNFDLNGFPELLTFISYKEYFAGFKNVTLIKQHGIFFNSDTATRSSFEVEDESENKSFKINVTKSMSSSNEWYELKIMRNNLFILNSELSMIKSGVFRENIIGLKHDSIINTPTTMMPKAKTSQNQTLKALRHMAGIDLDEKHTAANCLSAHAAQHGLEIPSKSETIIKYLYPNQS